jgi:aspartate aminotransferase
MTSPRLSPRITAAIGAMAPFLRFMQTSTWSRRDPDDPDTCDFVVGNPHEMPLPEFVAALERHVPPRDERWFAYKTNEDEPRRIVADALRTQRGLPFESDDVFLTNGAFAALSVALATLVGTDDEVVFISPPWFFYESIIAAYGATPVRVRVDPVTFDLDLDAIAAALTPRTRAIIVNSPHNPTGRIYGPDASSALAEILTAASARFRHPIYLLSDEAYSRIVFDGRRFVSPTAAYPWSMILYTYGKTLLTPGQRIGYIALPPALPDRPALREGLFAAQLVTGFAFPNALLQHALADLERLSIDVARLQRRRDRMVEALTGMGYEVHVPEGTFYVMVRTPEADDRAFCERLAAHRVFVLPGSVVEMPGTFRLSLTANDAMVERSLAGFAAAFRDVRGVAAS